MSKKQTAVNWLVEQLNNKGFAGVLTSEEIEQALEIEHDLIIQVAKDNCEELGDDEAEEYYNDQFVN